MASMTDMAHPEFSARMDELLRVLDGSDAIFREHWERPSLVRHKGALDLVTDTDLAIEAYLKDALRDIVPGAVFMAEESAAMAEPQGTCWIIDPVDGTTNLIHNCRQSAEDRIGRFHFFTVPLFY